MKVFQAIAEDLWAWIYFSSWRFVMKLNGFRRIVGVAKFVEVKSYVKGIFIVIICEINI